MPKERIPEFFIVDILISIDKIKRYFSDAPFEEFIKNQQAFDAIMRDLEIIGEALKYILNHQPFKQFINKDWREIIDFRNVITHHYFGINRQEIYDIICEDFPIFSDEFLIFTKKVKNQNLMDALSDAKQDSQKFGHFETLQYLEFLEKFISD